MFVFVSDLITTLLTKLIVSYLCLYVDGSFIIHLQFFFCLKYNVNMAT